MKKKVRWFSLRIQVPLMLALLVILMECVNIYVQYQHSYSYYMGDLYHEGDLLAKNARSEMQRYRLIGWLCDYWEAHYEEMDYVFDDPSAFAKKEIELRGKYPLLGELTDLDDVGLQSLDEEGQRLFAEICYAKLCRAFDRLKTIYDPVYLFSIRAREDGNFFLVTGTKGEERRIHSGGIVYELGSLLTGPEADSVIIDDIMRTGSSIYSEEMVENEDAGGEIANIYEPLIINGEVVAIIGVSLLSETMLREVERLTKRSVNWSVGLLLVSLVIISLLLHFFVLKPLAREQEIIAKYEKDKDGAAAVESLRGLKTPHNEVERMAESFASMVTELDRHIAEIVSVTEEKERFAAELDVASRIQAEMLPREFPAFPERKEFDLYASMTPAKYVGGDFYDYFFTDDDHLALVIADVSGKGVPASLFMMISMSVIRDRTLAGGASPAEILRHVNRQLCGDREDQLFVTVWLGILTISTGAIVCANAGHEYPAVGRPEDGYTLIRTKHGPPLGLFEEAVFHDEDLTLAPGDTLFLYTDGVPEAHNTAQEMFGEERMMQVLDDHANDAPQALLEAMKGAADTFAGDRDPFDDLTMLAIRLEQNPELQSAPRKRSNSVG